MFLQIQNKMLYKFAFTYPCPRKLREVMKMSMIQRQPTHKIKDIWLQYHNPRIANTCSIMQKDMYFHIKNKASKSPLFLLPVHRNNGHFKIITQWQSDCFLGTYLQDYKRQGTNSQPYIVFTLFTELLFSKGIVLVRGDIINNSMNKTQAIKFWQMLQQAYTHEDKFYLVDNFNHQTELFDQKKYNQIYRI